MKIAVVDDEKIFRDMLCEFIDKYYNDLDVVCTGFSDGKEIVRAYTSGRTFDVVFLDIEMPGIDGMKTAERIRDFSSDVPIVFFTSHTERAMDGYEVNAFRFLPKELFEEKLKKTLDDLSKSLSKTKKIVLKCGLQEYIVSPENILFAESDNNTVNVVTVDDIYSVRMKLSNFLSMLNDALPLFVRVHRCSVVNLMHVRNYTDKEVHLDNGKILPISKSCCGDFKKRIVDYIKHSAR